MRGNDTIPIGFCQCGCGRRTGIARWSDRTKGYVKGHPMRFAPGHRITPSIEQRLWSKVDRSGGPDACWPFRGSHHPDGYGHIRFEGKVVSAHRVAFSLTHGRMPNGLGCHTCDNPPCCNPSHIYDGTSSENQIDVVVRGRRSAPWGVTGERHHATHLTVGDVRLIRSLYASGRFSLRNLSTRFELGIPGIHAIVTRRNWKHVE